MNIQSSQHWLEIKMLFEEELDKLKKTIPYMKKDMEEVGKQYVANQEASKIIKRVIKRIETKTITANVKKESFK